jgi:2-hydroxychromene-2-carboxylate isomerase
VLLGAPDAFRCATERDIWMSEVERRAAAQGLQPLRWPPDWPTDTTLAMRVATYAKGIGKVAAFSLAAFRQAFAGGRDLSEPETVLIAAAAAEMHPAAVLKAAEMASVVERLERATAEASAAGVTEVPTLRLGDTLYAGNVALEQAAAANA